MAWKGELTQRQISALALSISSISFMLSGIVRQKLSITIYGSDVLAVVGQAALFQGLWLVVVGIAVLNSARVIASDGRYTEAERLHTASWISRLPIIAGIVMIPLAVLLSPRVSLMYTGSTAWAPAFALAATGGFIQVALQNLLSMTQILGQRREFIGAATSASFVSLATTTGLMLSQNVDLVFWTFVLVPLAGLVTLLCISPTSRQVIRARGTVAASHLKQAGQLALASSITAGLSLLVPSIITAEVAKTLGLESVALLQPALIVPTIASLVTASWTSVTMYHYNRTEGDESEIRRKGPWNDAVPSGVAVAVCCAIAVPVVPAGISLLYDDSLRPAASLVSIQLGAEVLTAIVWVAASMLLPQGRLVLAVALGACGQLLKLAIASYLLPEIGEIALPLGSLAQCFGQLVLLLLVLRPHLTRSQWTALLLLMVVSVTLSVSWLNYPSLDIEAWLTTLAFAVLALAMSVGAGSLLRPWKRAA